MECACVLLPCSPCPTLKSHPTDGEILGLSAPPLLSSPFPCLRLVHVPIVQEGDLDHSQIEMAIFAFVVSRSHLRQREGALLVHIQRLEELPNVPSVPVDPAVPAELLRQKPGLGGWVGRGRGVAVVLHWLNRTFQP